MEGHKCIFVALKDSENYDIEGNFLYKVRSSRTCPSVCDEEITRLLLKVRMSEKCKNMLYGKEKGKATLKRIQKTISNTN